MFFEELDIQELNMVEDKAVPNSKDIKKSNISIKNKQQLEKKDLDWLSRHIDRLVQLLNEIKIQPFEFLSAYIIYFLHYY